TRADLLLDRESSGWLLDEHPQHGRLQQQSGGVAELCCREEVGAGFLAIASATAALGARPLRSAAPATRRLAHSHVRGNGGPRAFARPPGGVALPGESSC